MRTRHAWLATVMLLALLGCSRTEAPAPGPAEPAKAVAVAVRTIARRAVPQTLEPVGTVRARKQGVLSSKLVAAVVAVHVVEGQRIRAGDLLVTLDNRDVQAQLRRARGAWEEARQALEETERALRASERAQEGARAQQDLTQATLARYTTLVDRGLVARQDYDEVAARARVATAEVAGLAETHAALAARRRQIVARIEQADAEVAGATIVTGYTKVLAPFDAVVVAKPVEVGNLAAPGVALLTVEDERYRLEAGVEESQIRQIRVGQRVPVVIDALGGERPGQVVEVVPASDPASRTFIVKIELPPEAGLRSGLYGRARFIVGERAALVVPRAALVERGQLQSVFVVDPAQRARLRLVRTGKTLGDDVEILAGLTEGERVVVEGKERLTDGSLVEPRG
jgi:multidrug efflux pump subunit AcrA (membrane-fusion protein)